MNQNRMVQNVLKSFTTSMDNIYKGSRRKKKLKLDTVIRLGARKGKQNHFYCFSELADD